MYLPPPRWETTYPLTWPDLPCTSGRHLREGLLDIDIFLLQDLTYERSTGRVGQVLPREDLHWHWDGKYMYQFTVIHVKRYHLLEVLWHNYIAFTRPSMKIPLFRLAIGTKQYVFNMFNLKAGRPSLSCLSLHPSVLTSCIAWLGSQSMPTSGAAIPQGWAKSQILIRYSWLFSTKTRLFTNCKAVPVCSWFCLGYLKMKTICH